MMSPNTATARIAPANCRKTRARDLFRFVLTAMALWNGMVAGSAKIVARKFIPTRMIMTEQ